MKYKTKPIIVDAIQWFKLGDHPDVIPCGTSGLPEWGFAKNERLREGGSVVCPGDWIITKPNGEIIVMNDAEFKERYEVLK